MVFRHRRRTEEGINPTALVDVMFNLLIFIVVTAQYTNIQALKVNLPKAESGRAVEEKVERLVVTLARNGTIYLNGDRTEESALPARLKPFGGKEPQPAVLIEADEGSTTGALVTVMDQVSKVGLKKVSIETRR